MFQLEITSIQEDIAYHKKELELAKARLDNIEVASEYSTSAIASLEDCLSHIESAFLSILKDRIDQMFSDNNESRLSGPAHLTSQEIKEKVPQGISWQDSEEELQPEETEKEEPQEVQTHTKGESCYATPDIERIDGSLVYSHVDSIVYVAGRSKGRLDNYGVYLTKILDIGDKYTVSKEPSFFETKYELRIEGFNSFEDALHLQSFDLLKEYDHSVNEEARELWRNTRLRKYESACKPNPKLTPLEDINLGDIVYLNSIDNQYKVQQKVELDGVPHIEVLCAYNSERPSLVGAISYLKECYKVLPEDIQIDPTLVQEEQEEEVLTETVAVYKPKEKPVLKKVETEFTTESFPAGPYQKISLDEINFGDIITTNPHSKSAYEVKAHNGDCIVAVCLYNQALPLRVGEEFYFKVPYLVEKATEEVMDTSSPSRRTKEAHLRRDEAMSSTIEEAALASLLPTSVEAQMEAEYKKVLLY